MAMPSMFLGVCLFKSVLILNILLPRTPFEQAIISLFSILLAVYLLVTSEDPVEDSLMEEGDKPPKCQVSIFVSGAAPDAEDPLVSPWLEMAVSLVAEEEGDDDNAVDIDHEQHHPPQELYLLLDEGQTPPPIRDIVLNSLNIPEDAVPVSEMPQASEEPPSDPYVEEIPDSRGALQVTPVGSPSDMSHSPSTSTTSSSLSTSPTTNGSVDGARSGSNKSIFSALLSSRTNIIGPMKQAMKDRPSIGKSATYERSPRAVRSFKSECASCLEDLPTRKMYKLECKHSYCRECITTLITTAVQTESMFPPKCCLVEIPIKDILSTLDKVQKELYKSKAAEYTLKPENRWYCPDPKCQKWIPPSKLHRLRAGGAKCPSCDTRICGYCRGAAHAAGADCPEDFGLEATLEEAERQGWRRCHKCRALVELTTATARRVARDVLSREEEEDLARAVSAIEEMERREAEERQRREEYQRTSEAKERRRRQHLERLEAEKRRIEQEEATRRREQAIRKSLTERFDYLQGALLEIQQFQQSSLISRHNSEITSIIEEAEHERAVQKAESDSLHMKLDSNSTLRRNILQSAHMAAVSKLTSEHEAEEDDTFLSMQTHLRGKPNQESRLNTVLDKLRQRQKVEMDILVCSQKAETTGLAENVAVERKALVLGYEVQSVIQNHKFRESGITLKKTVLAERKWFEVIAERRRVMMQELQRRLWEDSGLDPVSAARTVVPGGGGQVGVASSSESATQGGRSSTDELFLVLEARRESWSRPRHVGSVGA
ncbi:hypothetical protein EPUS_01847 [Endocarpon pusillum Z07020]|uniref:RING-type domain-containing protein n=1 Tax=Endocarpon pusillum (strain Z07020 / HMAS-L-300199) TaxID=1263415 RepID=U1GBT6_ENDPU|nr:uncharacterized protein EPUS_01847 [Endocarpon pusillum Z07020]ERF69518.1 hypothetical protein EPUS_01847 [Endocarpon pusillum Z07020]